MMPAANASAEDSARNDVMMASGLNPNARNVPISLVRADTAAYIVFIASKNGGGSHDFPLPTIQAPAGGGYSRLFLVIL